MVNSVYYILAHADTCEMPLREVDNYIEIVSLASATTPDNFEQAKQYMLRHRPELQALYLITVIRSPVGPSLKNLPEYISWYSNQDLMDAVVSR